MTNPLLFKIVDHPYAGIFATLGLGILGLPIPDETAMAFAGFLAFKGTLNLIPAVTAAYAGTTCGITLGYLLGRFLGSPFLERYAAHLLSPDHLRKAQALYVRYGPFALLIGYFIPGVRHLTAIFAGMALMPYRTFALVAYSGAFLWTVTFFSIGYLFAEEWHRFVSHSQTYILPTVLFISVIFGLILWRRIVRRNHRESH